MESTIINWNNDDITNEEVNILKAKVYELIPESKGKKICVINPNLSNLNNPYFIITEISNKFIYCTLNNKNISFDVREGSYKDLIPKYFDIKYSFVKNISCGILYLIFGKITGLHFLHWSFIPNNSTNWSQYGDQIFHNEDDWSKAVQFIKKNQSFEILSDSEKISKIIKYSFASDDIINYRKNQWYKGKWVDYDKLGIKSLETNTQYSQLTLTSGKLETIDPSDEEDLMSFDEEDLMSYDDFINVIQYCPFHRFICDHCRMKIDTNKTYFAKTNIEKNLCKVCYDSKAHNFTDEFECVSENNDIIDKVLALSSKYYL